MLGRMLAVLCLAGTACSGQGLKGDLQSVPYELLEQFATERIDFEAFEEWTARPSAIPEKLETGRITDYSVVGIEPVSMIFEENQTAVGFSIISLNRTSQRRWVQSSSPDTSVQVKFYRRNGSLISQVSFYLEGTHHLAFARCGGAIDIAGIQITNSSEVGLAKSTG